LNVVDTLRVSVTDRCNLRCIYCMPPEGIKTKPHNEILRFEEIERVVRAAVTSGVRKVRLTGGEPLVRQNVERLVEMLAAIDGLDDLAMTTNGVLLAEKAATLKKAGLGRITISLDTLNPERYPTITRGAKLEQALAGIDAALEARLEPVKVNVVVMRDVNHDEVVDFAQFAAERAIEVRFIELMPVAANAGILCCNRKGDALVASAEVKKQIEAAFGKLERAGDYSGGPARLFGLPGGRSRIGFISAVTEPFCSTCTRMRLTADGKLRGCLFSSSETDVLDLMRSGADDEKVLETYREAVRLKPRRNAPVFSDNKRWMSEIGG